MFRTNQVLWFFLILILFLPSTLGRFLLDLAGSLVILLFISPIILGGLGWVGWKILQSRVLQCKVCGYSSLNNILNCPVCGSEMQKGNKSNKYDKESFQASNATIDINVEKRDLEE